MDLSIVVMAPKGALEGSIGAPLQGIFRQERRYSSGCAPPLAVVQIVLEGSCPKDDQARGWALSAPPARCCWASGPDFLA